MLNLKRTTKTVVLSLLFLLPLNLAAQEHETVGSPNETAGSFSVAAFDLPWLAKYYGWDWGKCRVPSEMSAGQEDAAGAESIISAASADGTEAAEQAAATAKSTTAKQEAKPSYSTFSLRANLLRWATLTPDLGIEWRISPSVGVLVNGTYTSWSWNNASRRYALWEISPEVRWYLGREKCGYLGAMYKAGSFNYKLSSTGRQGDIMGGGLTGGYMLRLNKALALDFSLAVGCLHADYEKYTVIDGVRVSAGTGTKNWWGPVNAGVTLVWNLF